MKIKGVILILAFGSALDASAQGVLLGANDTLAIGFDHVNGCYSTEASPGSYVGVGFGADVLSAGDALRVEMFENGLSDLPFASQIYSPTMATSFVVLYGPSSGWLDNQGVIRVSMLSGSVEIDYAHFIVSPNAFTYCDTIVPVPEPNTITLLFFSSSVFWICYAWKRKRKREHA